MVVSCVDQPLIAAAAERYLQYLPALFENRVLQTFYIRIHASRIVFSGSADCRRTTPLERVLQIFQGLDGTVVRWPFLPACEPATSLLAPPDMIFTGLEVRIFDAVRVFATILL
jgi:hypothetical protein